VAALSSTPLRGVLLIHGLGDSPWTFVDLGQSLANQGFLVRTVLLPGHGAQPSDILDTTANEWRSTVWEQAAALQRDVTGDVYLGGFSTGANLALEYAYAHPDIAGLLLFSPAYKSLPFDWAAPLLSRARPWLIMPGEDHPGQNTVRYLNVPTNGFAQFYRTSSSARRLLRARSYVKPVFMVVAEHDSVLNTRFLLRAFVQRFPHPRSRLVWYGALPKSASMDQRVLSRPDHLPKQRISQFSHMGLMFSPDNPLYGTNGHERICLNGQSKQLTKACKTAGDVWYSDWGYQEDGKIHARLTFNPYWQWQSGVLRSVLAASQPINE